MTKRNIKYIDGGSPEYWRQRTEGFRLIREAERAYERVQREPQYRSGGYDENGDVIAVDNCWPEFEMQDAIAAIEANETAVDILVAQRRTSFGSWEVRAVIRTLREMDDASPDT